LLNLSTCDRENFMPQSIFSDLKCPIPGADKKARARD
jgi:hypothetical protein